MPGYSLHPQHPVPRLETTHSLNVAAVPGELGVAVRAQNQSGETSFSVVMVVVEPLLQRARPLGNPSAPPPGHMVVCGNGADSPGQLSLGRHRSGESRGRRPSGHPASRTGLRVPMYRAVLNSAHRVLGCRLESWVPPLSLDSQKQVFSPCSLWGDCARCEIPWGS